MPLYEYRCSRCGKTFERLDPHYNLKPEGLVCPYCGSEKTIERILYASAIHFKGKGWYVTDYKNEQKS